MRDLGVTRWADIELGPPPPEPAKPAKEMGEDELFAARRAHKIAKLRTALASTGFSPSSDWMRRFFGDDA